MELKNEINTKEEKLKILEGMPLSIFFF